MRLLEASLSASAKIDFIKVNSIRLIEGITWVAIAQSRRSSKFCWVLDVKWVINQWRENPFKNWKKNKANRSSSSRDQLKDQEAKSQDQLASQDLEVELRVSTVQVIPHIKK